jgi:SAM-dependent methyltransferase
MSDATGRGLELFFDERASVVTSALTREDLCFASGRDPRFWSDDRLYEDMVQSICDQAGILSRHAVLEVGCAAGFIAQGLAPRCGSYTGVDVAPAAIARARILRIRNARFEVADGTALPMRRGVFDCAFSYDVFTNFEGFDVPRRIMREMVRVVTPGGAVLIGSIPDAACQQAHEGTNERVGQSLEKRYGPARPPTGQPGPLDRIRHWYRRRVQGIRPDIRCYYFRKADFEAFGREHGLSTQFNDIHPLNPYVGLRFNVVFHKPIS